MGIELVENVKLGDKLDEEVLTPLGGVLFHKGRIVMQKELDILQAFLITHVTLEEEKTKDGKTGESNAEEKPSQNASKQTTNKQAAMKQTPTSPLQQEYDNMVQLLRETYNTFVSGQNMPIMDIRVQMEKLLQQLSSYNILKFVPISFQERDYLLHNSVACAMTSYMLAQWVNIPQREWMQVALAGLLKDIGNIRINRAILTNPKPLSAGEQEEMKRHTVLGYQMLKSVAALNEGVKLSALQHHEKIDGTGYPLGIDSTKIHPYARIVSIADIFHAMTLNKAYRKAASPYLVLEQIQSDAFGKLDPAYVRIFVQKTTQFHNGTVVRLSDKRIGEIVFSDQTHPTRPWVSINGSIVNLVQERNLYIEEVIK
ncbi:HD-GYP domain-containing protein [Paenibacillus sp. HB172176]|uniref:HD-GYP domain-containing protein n=1 Tax=Paenibacillus sp. HB172176 TaxID=2493690 RepID=UPI001F1085C8|nr:HD-GYP domain-containing protein [Paenibacillus sp. HB172176]